MVWAGSSNIRSLLTSPDIAREGATPQEKWNGDVRKRGPSEEDADGELGQEKMSPRRRIAK
jgi:hypothetical protein